MKKTISLFAMIIFLSSTVVTGAFAFTEDFAEEGEVTCNCAFWGGNDDCLANNNGETCKADTSQDDNCRTHDPNCGSESQ